MSNKICLQCGNYLYRSHSRNLREKLIRTFSPLKMYRCHECNWRGWHSPSKPKVVEPTSKKLLPILLSLLVTLLITLLAMYFAGT